jgi:hypothetical protein
MPTIGGPMPVRPMRDYPGRGQQERRVRKRENDRLIRKVV